jgi:hypothetical protein
MSQLSEAQLFADHDHWNLPVSIGSALVRRPNLNENRRLKNAARRDAGKDNLRRAMKMSPMMPSEVLHRYATTLCRVCSRNWDA